MQVNLIFNTKRFCSDDTEIPFKNDNIAVLSITIQLGALHTLSKLGIKQNGKYDLQLTFLRRYDPTD